jgi:Dipeptidyl peptidase IV (DPP IV) N-terminal region
MKKSLGFAATISGRPTASDSPFFKPTFAREPTHPVTDYIRMGIVAHMVRRVRWIDLDTTDAYIPRFGRVDSRTLFAIVFDRKQERVDLNFIDVKSGSAKCVLTETSDAYTDVQKHAVFRPLRSANRFLRLSRKLTIMI